MACPLRATEVDAVPLVRMDQSRPQTAAYARDPSGERASLCCRASPANAVSPAASVAFIVPPARSTTYTLPLSVAAYAVVPARSIRISRGPGPVVTDESIVYGLWVLKRSRPVGLLTYAT